MKKRITTSGAGAGCVNQTPMNGSGWGGVTKGVLPGRTPPVVLLSINSKISFSTSHCSNSCLTFSQLWKT